MSTDPPILEALRTFAAAVTDKTTALTAGEPEDQLRAPFEAFMAALGDTRHVPVVCAGEAKLGRLGKPDYAVHSAKLLAGYVELKAPGTGANPARFTGHNREQWKRFQAIPNLLYCDGNEWALYRSGKRERGIVRLSGDVAADGKRAVAPEDGKAVWALLADFLSWHPIIPKAVKDLAGLLAPLCRMLRDDVTDALKDAASPLVQLAGDWRQLLFPDASDEQFADAYAQTVTFALLLARSEGADPLDLASAEAGLAAEHSLLSRALQVLTDPDAQAEISASLKLLLRVIGEVPQGALTAQDDKKDPWLFFYEDFLAAYDPKLRKDAGAYYTPVEVVRAQVRLIDDLLTNRLGKPLGFADPGVVTLDPAAGTGTYLLGVIDHALGKVETQQGAGAVPGQASALAKNIYGFEIMVGPFAVAELRVSRALADRGAKLPAGGSHVYLTDTLEGPNTPPPALPFYLKPIAEQHAKALKVKAAVPVIVCLGNPPYDRHEAADETNKARTGHWVRWGENGEGVGAILNDFIAPAVAAGHSRQMKWLYNLYVYFWRWALWKVFEAKTAAGPGVASFISASSYLAGDAFCGMREHMRRVCDEVWILDLGGEGRGPQKDHNVFAIQTPVAIAIAVRYGKLKEDTPAKVHYALIDGTRDGKLKALDAVADFASLTWQDCPGDWRVPFKPMRTGDYFACPRVNDILPWTHSGMQTSRNWVIAPTQDSLESRWRNLLSETDAKKRAKLALETSSTPISKPQKSFLSQRDLPSIDSLSSGDMPDRIVKILFRTLDSQHCLADSRLIHRPRPDLWRTLSGQQIFLLTNPQQTTVGPSVVATSMIPDFNAFNNRLGMATPLYRDAAGKQPNILPGLLDLLAKKWHGHLARNSRAGTPCHITPEDFLAYVYGVLAQPAFTERFADELGTRELRVPLTKDAALFAKVRDVGAKLLWLHTYGERYVPKGKHKGQVPKAAAKCKKAVPGDEAGYPDQYDYNEATKTLHVGAGEFAPVAPEVYAFEVSGLKVVQSWLGYRMKNPKGKKSSPLDDINPTLWPPEFTTELLELLWVLEATLAEYPAQAELLSAVVKGPCFGADELPDVPDHMRKPPKRKKQAELFDTPEEDE